MSDSGAIEVWDNTGGDSPDEKTRRWGDAKTPWPVGPFDGLEYLFPTDDPRSTVLLRAKQRMDLGDKGRWVLVEESEIDALLRLRICRSTHVFSSEIGLTKPFTAHCIFQAGHTGYHSNGYYTWEPQLIVVT